MKGIILGESMGKLILGEQNVQSKNRRYLSPFIKRRPHVWRFPCDILDNLILC